jgi:hypothetical protein
MIETITLVLFIMAVLFVALMAPKPSGQDKKPSGQDPKPSGQDPKPSGQDKKPSGQEKTDPDSPGD